MMKPCPKCSQMNPPDAAFCLNCSSSLGPTVGGPAYQQQTPPFVGNQGPYVGAPPQQVGQNFGGYGAPPPAQSGQRAMISLILAIVGLICCGPLTGIPAAILGWLELDAIKNGKAPASGKLMAQIGLWGGIAVSILHSIAFVLFSFLSMLPAAF